MTRAQSNVVATVCDADGGLTADRIRVAHELHDSVIQALVAINLQLAVLERSPADERRLRRQLADTQNAIRSCIGDLRELIVRIKPIFVEARELPSVVATLAERFEHDSGVRTQFLCTGTPVRMSPEACGQIVRIAQEALMNVRRHSGAKNVLISLNSDPRRIQLTVDDDGCGFPFEGRWDSDALDRARRGPVVIKERVRLLNGTLTVESTPGHGARIDVIIPCSGLA